MTKRLAIEFFRHGLEQRANCVHLIFGLFILVLVTVDDAGVTDTETDRSDETEGRGCLKEGKGTRDAVCPRARMVASTSGLAGSEGKRELGKSCSRAAGDKAASSQQWWCVLLEMSWPRKERCPAAGRPPP